ncbi:MAG TPA: hypothetical protein VKB51_15580 [bacterium]|nr:hypothetical protein [bacterium]
MERPGRIADPEDAPLSPGEARLEALLDERFSSAQRDAFARELDAHDRGRGEPVRLDPALVRRNLRFQGAVPEKVRALLKEWVPELMAHAAARGLALRDPHQELRIYTRSAFEQEQGALPPGLKLPASSFQHDPLYRRYSIRVVLPEAVRTLEELFTVLRALLTRLYGDIFLREEIYPLAAYREDVEHREAQVSVGLAEQIAVLAELPHTTRALDRALADYARTVGINFKRHPEQARRAWFKELAQDLALQRLTPDRRDLSEEAFLAYLQALLDDVPVGVAALVETVETQDRQLHFLPPGEAPDYERLRQQNPLHFLRSAKLRLEFLIEAFGGLIEDFEALATPGAGYPALAEERVAGTIAELERGGLARAYLVPEVRLSEDLERKRNGFPLEVHALMAAYPPEQQTERLFRTLSKRLEGSLHQRLYNALVLLRHWMRLHDTGREDTFAGSPQFQTLKGLVANFRFRKPLLESLFLRIGIVLEVAEHAPDAPGAEGERKRFPVDEFARAWGQFVAHALLADYLAGPKQLKGFDPDRYWQRVEERLRAQVAAGNGGAQLMHLLRCVQVAAGAEAGLPVLGEVLRQSTPTFRFTVAQALRPRPEGKDAAAWLAQLDAWAESVLQAREGSLRNAIVIEGTPRP